MAANALSGLQSFQTIRSA